MKIGIGESIQMLANIGVLAGIVFLGFEIRQNTTAVRSQASQGLQEQIQAFHYLAATDKPLRDVMAKAGDDTKELSADEFLVLTSVMRAIFSANQNLYYQVREGAYDSELAEGWWQVMRDALEPRSMWLAWQSQRHIFSEEFRSFVEDDVMQRDRTPPFRPSMEREERP